MDIRERIIEAADRVIRTQGLPKTTTKEIAHAAGCSEGSLYNHFEDKESLLLAVMAERMPGFIPLIMTLHQRVGTGSVRDNLEEVARTALAFYVEGLAICAVTLVTPELREGLRRRNMGPHRGNEGLAAYLQLEQQLGRIHPSANPKAAAALLLGACHQRAIHALLLGDDPLNAQDERFAKDLVETLMQGLLPREE